MEKVWDFVWNKLFDERTCMFYNYLTGHEPDAATKYLPEPKLIQHHVPNPAGYGTAMEDCMLNAGLMMDAVVSRYEVSGDTEMKTYADKIFRGMELDATVSPQKGFLPRGVSPADCQSHYIDTSRDQYTNWIYGAFRFYYSDLSDDRQKESIRHILIAMSEKMEAEIIPQNNHCFLREDGKIGSVGQMWGDIHSHEFLRLPMLYLLTWKTTKIKHFETLYLRYRDEALIKTMNHVPLSSPTYAGLQLQFSLRLVHDLDGASEVKEACAKFMKKMSAPYLEMSVDKAAELMTEEGSEWLAIPYVNWKEAKARYAGIWGELAYFIPEPTDSREHLSYYALRAVGEGFAVASLCPNIEIPNDKLEILCRMAEFVDYGKHSTCAPIALLQGYWLAKRNRKNS
ncbi:MAG: hypothetical protein IKM29_01690 [Clostridia bacterium]|nr:hypothetical protein [Clostridia bacterium]